MRLNFRSLFAAALVLGSATLAIAGNTVLFSSSKGDLVFPISPPTSAGAAGAIDNMVIGATTPRAATVTNLTASGTVSGAGITGLLAAPGAIGGTTPAAGSFTTLSGSTSVTGGTGSFTTLTASDQISSTAGATTIGSGACGATTNGTVSGTNQSGLITIGAASTTTCTVGFSKTLGVAPGACVLFPANAGAAAAGTTVARVSSISTSQFVVTGSALANANYYYLCL